MTFPVSLPLVQGDECHICAGGQTPRCRLKRKRPPEDDGFCAECNRLVAVTPGGVILPHSVLAKSDIPGGWNMVLVACDGTGQKEQPLPDGV